MDDALFSPVELELLDIAADEEIESGDDVLLGDDSDSDAIDAVADPDELGDDTSEYVDGNDDFDNNQY